MKHLLPRTHKKDKLNQMVWEYVLRLSAFLLIFFSPHFSLAGEKIDFWNIQRKGANFFNVEPQEKWFQDAQKLGIQWVRIAYEKWKGNKPDFLIGNAKNFKKIISKDLSKLIKVIDWAHKYGIKVVIAPLGLPGNRWKQNNSGREDLRLWNDQKYWQQAVNFWRELADALKNHPAVFGYNILNEPTPELGTDILEHGLASRYLSWYKAHRGTSRDLPAFYEKVIAAIRTVDMHTPIMLDAGWYAQPSAFVHWPRINDDKVLYSFHMYEPYSFTSKDNFKNKKKLKYPGTIPFAGSSVDWNREQIKRYIAPFIAWAKHTGIAANRLVVGEFGCFRRNHGCDKYLTDLIGILNEYSLHWAFYAFREDEWDGYDYEVGTGGLGWKYWKAKNFWSKS